MGARRHDGPTLATKVRRHVRWARADGLGRLVEEDGLNPIAGVRAAASKWRWRRAAGVAPGTTTPVFVVGAQRSGTNMLVRELGRRPEVEVHNENDRRVFDRYQLRSLTTLRDVVRASRHLVVLFKPLCDSDRTAELLDTDLGARPAKALWVYRDVAARARSAEAKFGDANLRALRVTAAGDRSSWVDRRASPATLHLVRSVVDGDTTALTAAALFWYVRNALYFDLGLDRRNDVRLVRYESVVDDPLHELADIAAFVGVPWPAGAPVAVERRTVARPIEIDPRVREACDDLDRRLRDAALTRTRSHPGPGRTRAGPWPS